MAATIKDLEEANTNQGITITKITPLRRKPRADRTSRNQSIIVFTENPHAADECIKLGFYINSERHKAEKYAPQLHITQCYKCFEYGHRATHCKRKEKCGNCGSESHPTTECQSLEHHCCGCKGSHQAWFPECPHRTAEGQRLMELRMETSPFYTS